MKWWSTLLVSSRYGRAVRLQKTGGLGEAKEALLALDHWWDHREILRRGPWSATAVTRSSSLLRQSACSTLSVESRAGPPRPNVGRSKFRRNPPLPSREK